MAIEKRREEKRIEFLSLGRYFGTFRFQLKAVGYAQKKGANSKLKSTQS